MSSEIGIVWFKRDLRLTDHEPLAKAIHSQIPILAVYDSLHDGRENSLYKNFTLQSIYTAATELSKYTGNLLLIRNGLVSLLNRLIQNNYTIKYIYSHAENGAELTWAKDCEIARWCRENHVTWLEFRQHAILRAQPIPANWRTLWVEFMEQPTIEPDLSRARWVTLPSDWFEHEVMSGLDVAPQTNSLQQPGGESYAHKYLTSFLDERCRGYLRNISRPEASRKSCSRLSPYIAWGNISIKQVIRAVRQHPRHTHALTAFEERLCWHNHFLQKLERNVRYATQNLNPSFDAIRQDWNQTYFDAWKDGLTGYPLVDASMRALKATGYVNFRMRAVLVSFLTHHLWLDWQEGGEYLASLFLDYEPGIHYCQLQMQAGTVGTHLFRIYNPTTQAVKHDPEAVFIKKWVPELANIPVPQVFEPWKMNRMEELFYACQIGIDYPKPIVDIAETGEYARKILWSIQESEECQRHIARILQEFPRLGT
jgi:deoxyribodipyrimidine photo-lyase